MAKRSLNMWRKTKNILLISCLSVLIIDFPNVDARQSEKRRKDKASTPEKPHTTNICDIIDRNSKVHCYCEAGASVKNASRAECWVFNGGIPIDDPIWDAFQSQNRLQDLSFNVRADGGLAFVPTRALKPMHRLKKLIIKYGNIDELYSFAFANLSSLKEISLTRNKIVILEPNAIAHLPNLTTLSLDDNRLAEIPRNAFVDLPMLQKLYLTNNNLSILHDGAFKHLVQLLELELDKNSIVTLTKETFDGLANLKRLDLRNNRMKMLGDFTFAELWNLQELLLDGNELKFISERAFDGLSQLKKLSLSENRLGALTSGLFEGVRGLAFVDLRKNRLQTLSIDDIRPILDNLKNASSLLLLEGNHFICDCRLSWMHMLRNETKNEKTKSSLEQITCSLEPSSGTQHVELLDKLKPLSKPFEQNLDNRLQEKNTQKTHSHKTTAEYIDSQDKDNMEDTEYDEAQKDSFDNNVSTHNDSTIKNENLKHLFQIPVEHLPCPEELKDSTDAPLSRPSRGEVKDFRGQNAASSFRVRFELLLLPSCILWIAIIRLTSVECGLQNLLRQV